MTIGRILTGQSALLQFLFEKAVALTQRINLCIGQEVLYLIEGAGIWMLFGRGSEEDADKLVLCGEMNVDELVRLVCRLQEKVGA